jgi:hypothetical protein
MAGKHDLALTNNFTSRDPETRQRVKFPRDTLYSTMPSWAQELVKDNELLLRRVRVEYKPVLVPLDDDDDTEG